MNLEMKMCLFSQMQQHVRAELESARYNRTVPFRKYNKIDPNRHHRLRQSTVDPFAEIEATLARGMAKRSRPVDARSETVAAVFQEIPAYHERFMAYHRQVREGALAVAQKCTKALTTVERKKLEQKEKEEKERMRLLRTNNYDEYVKLLRQTKNKRLNEILDQTDKFLQDIGIKVLVQKTDTRRIQERIADETDEVPVTEIIDSSIPPPNNTDVTGVMDYYSSVHKVREEVQQPSTLCGGTLMQYQVIGLQWLVSLYNNKLHGILADEMGLGKTVQTIALLGYLAEYKANPGPHLVVVPLSTMPNWQSEFERWLPSFKVIAFKGSKDQRKDALREMRGDDVNVVLTTYDFILREKGPLTRKNWKHIIVDEGHRMKNAKSRLHQVLNGFSCCNRLLLTGTPLQNNLTELWALLNFLLPKIFQSADDFENWFNEPFSRMNSTAPTSDEQHQLSEEEQMLIIHRLHIVLRPFLLRREKVEVLKDLPDKQEFVIRVELSEWQKQAYEQMSMNALRVVDSDGKMSSKSMQNSLMQLRKICNHPYLFCDEYRIDRDLYRVSGKFEVLDRMLPKLVHFGHKILIFSQMTQLMDVLADYFDWRGLKYHRLDGSTPVDERRERMHQFNTKDDVHIFMLSTRAGGLGLNLQSADTVIIFDSDFNPQMDLQAQDRAHRVGQKNQVRVFRLITESRIEQGILDKAHHKLDIDQKIIQAGMFNRNSSEEDRRERLKTIMGGGSTRSTWDGGPTAPEQLNRMMARSTDEFQYFQQIDANAMHAKKDDPECSLLVQTGRLIAPNEVPEWARTVEIKPDDLEEVELTRDMRRKESLTVNLDNLTEHQWIKLMEAQEAGQEYSVPHPKKRRKIEDSMKEDEDDSDE
jgi:SNF2 family DNA or RNA helicase